MAFEVGIVVSFVLPRGDVEVNEYPVLTGTPLEKYTGVTVAPIE
jgi:hypothetical protein